MELVTESGRAELHQSRAEPQRSGPAAAQAPRPGGRLAAHPEGIPRTLVDSTADLIRSRILDGELAAGERLPSEKDLVRELGVSRTVLREALSFLEALGMLERRSAHGRYVAAGGSPARSEALVRAWLHQRAAEISEVDEVRALTEAHAIRGMSESQAHAAAWRGRLLVADQRAAVERGDPVQAAEIDGAFHALLCSYTANGMLRSLVTGLIGHARRAAVAVYSLPAAAERSLHAHEAIVEALAQGDREQAAAVDFEHHLRTQASFRAGADGT